MNLNDAIKAHTDWKLTLQQYLRKPDGRLNVAHACADDRCQLGKWIQGEGGASFGKLGEFGDLKKAHTAFHVAVGAVIAKADQGASVSEDIALGSKSPFALTSMAVVTAILKLSAKLPKAA